MKVFADAHSQPYENPAGLVPPERICKLAAFGGYGYPDDSLPVQRRFAGHQTAPFGCAGGFHAGRDPAASRLHQGSLSGRANLRYGADNAAEQQILTKLQQRGYDVAFFLAGRKILAEAQPLDRRRYLVEGPAFMT